MPGAAPVTTTGADKADARNDCTRSQGGRSTAACDPERSGRTRIWGAEGNWKVPGITRQTALPEYSATWVGVDGLTNSNLIQTGTSENTNNAQDPMPSDHAPYFAWFEILPEPEDTIVYADGHYCGLPVTVKPGDKIFAGVDRVSSDYCQILIEDTTGHYEDRHGWVFNQDFSYYGQHSSAEWIQEADVILVGSGSHPD
jgi:hypothetical protein